MHPRQANLLAHAKTAADQTSENPRQAATPPGYLWKYTDPEGNVFYMDEKKLTLKSPVTGKTFTAKPTKHTPMQVSKDLKEEAPKTASVDRWKV